MLLVQSQVYAKINLYTNINHSTIMSSIITNVDFFFFLTFKFNHNTTHYPMHDDERAKESLRWFEWDKYNESTFCCDIFYGVLFKY